MKLNSNIAAVLSGRGWRSLQAGLLLAGVALVAGSCMTSQQQGETPAPADTGIKFSHGLHAEQGMNDCTVCHDTANDDRRWHLSMTGHELCSVCHEIPDFADATPETCGVCHTNEDYTVTENPPLLGGDLKFEHAPHIAKAVECATCHVDLDKQPLPKPPLKPFCMDCHGKTDPKLNECSVCHTEMSKDVVPQFRGGKRIPHDAPEIWESVHGREARVNAAFCNLCHDEQQSCEDCHSRVAPKDHTLAWRRKTHGLQATWDRSSCAVCHEEDSCLKCHRNTTPSSHRAGWGSPLNRHCANCHYPAEESGCTVCHETIEHDRAMPSPHNLGLFPPNCNLCHPGGLPHQAPHLLNSTVHCVVCHK